MSRTAAWMVGVGVVALSAVFVVGCGSSDAGQTPDAGAIDADSDGDVPEVDGALAPPDAASSPDGANSLPQVSGEFLLALSLNISPTTPIQLRMQNMLIRHPDGTGTLAVTMTPLRVSDRTDVGTPIVVLDVPVATNGAFTITANDAMIPGAANPITGSDIIADFVLTGVLDTPDRLCGDLSGMVTSPLVLDLVGSTFSAIRITPGATGSELPPPELACPPSAPDAGVPDAS